MQMHLLDCILEETHLNQRRKPDKGIGINLHFIVIREIRIYSYKMQRLTFVIMLRIWMRVYRSDNLKHVIGI